MTGNPSTTLTAPSAQVEGRSFDSACLEVMGSGPACNEYQITAKPLTVGRDRQRCDIIVDGTRVSRKHARIEPLGQGKFQLLDLQSTNGVYVNNQKIDASCLLVHNNIIGLGRPGTAHLRFCSFPCEQQSHVDLLPPQSSWTIGRSPNCDICLPFVPTVSAHHATVYVRNGQLFLKDESSLNGTWKNGRSLQQGLLAGKDIIVIGSTEFRFYLQKTGSLQIQQQRRTGDIRLRCTGLTCSPGKASAEPPILNNIELSFNPGELIGILGPSGAGKTTLLKTLSGHIPPDSGAVLVNDIPLYGSYEMFRSSLGYVPQDDILHQELSVEVSLDYIARLRLPHDVDARQRKDIVNSTLEVLNLSRVRKSRIDQLSGGQRKRVSTAAELITRPGLLFLDEPTSGLDPGIEEKLMRHFKTMAEAGTTMVMTTHNLNNFGLLDKIVLLARGELVFFGTPSEAMEFFRQQSSISSPTDIFHVLEKAPDRTGTAFLRQESMGRKAVAVHYADQYRNSVFFKKNIGNNPPSSARTTLITQQHLKTTILDNQSFGLHYSRLKKKVLHSFSFSDWLTLSRRHFRIRLSSPKRVSTYVLIPVLLALVTLSQNIKGFTDQETVATQLQTIKFQVRSGGPLLAASLKTLLSPEGMDDPRKAWEILHAVRYQGPANLPIPMTVLLMGIMTSVFLGTITSCLEISSERRIYQRERMSGMRIFDYLGSKLPFCLSVTAVQCFIFLGCCSLHPFLRPLSFLPIWLTMVGVAWTSVCMGLCISGIDPTSGRFSVLLAVAGVLPQLILSGGLAPDFYANMNVLTRIPAILLPARWGLEMGLTGVYDNNGETTVPWIPDFVHRMIGFDYGTTVYYHGVSVLAVQAVVWLLLCAWLQKRRDPI
jgi:ABC-type multidrug transport system ATPase subunit/pSer/pThr/pTyr-binding forkhead associated (FHA) protein/ABC-type multidrug transport system permease subunit